MVHAQGHVESDEAFDSTAEREVWEETGVHGRVIKELGVIDYWFISEGKRIHKTVHHFLLRFVDGDLNDEDPEVTEVTWVPVDSLVERLAYADERKLARRAHNLLPDLARAEKQAGPSHSEVIAVAAGKPQPNSTRRSPRRVPRRSLRRAVALLCASTLLGASAPMAASAQTPETSAWGLESERLNRQAGGIHCAGAATVGTAGPAGTASGAGE